MQLLIALFSCLLSLLAGDGPGSQTHITFAARSDGLLLSRSIVSGGQATFHCISSRSGTCHYRVYDRQCERGTGTQPPQPEPPCRSELGRFELAVGTRHRLRGLPSGFGQCVAAVEGGGCG